MKNLRARFNDALSAQAARQAVDRDVMTSWYRRFVRGLSKLLPGRYGPARQVEAWDRRVVENSGLFDAGWYRRKNPDVTADPLSHFLRQGWREGRSPGPLFETAWYLDRHPDVATSGQNPLLHYLNFGAREGRDPRSLHKQRLLIELSGLFDEDWYVAQGPDVDRRDAIGHYIEFGWWEGRAPGPAFNAELYPKEHKEARARGIDPLLHYLTRNDTGLLELLGPPPPDPLLVRTVARLIEEAESLQPLVGDSFRKIWLPGAAWVTSIPLSRVSVTWRKAYASLQHAYDYLIFVPSFPRGGAEVVAANIVRAAIEKHGADRVLLVTTDAADMAARDWLPPQTHIMALSDLEPDLSPKERAEIVRALVLCLKPRSVMNVNSHACWETMKTHGRGLSRTTKLFACLFCHDYSDTGRAIGYAATHFREAFPHLTKVYFDNVTFLNSLARELALSPDEIDRLSVLRQPAAVNMERRARPARSDRLRVLWAARLSRQKNIDVLIKIVKRSGDMDFSIYGGGADDIQEKMTKVSQTLDNMKLYGAHTSFEALPVETHDVFLFTSLWEGMPNSILAAGALGIPIVASDVGGIGEIISSDTGWLVRRFKEAEPYCRALRDIAANPDEAQRRADRLYDRILAERSWRSFVADLEAAPSVLD